MRKIALVVMVGLLVANFAFCQAAEKPVPPQPQNIQPQGAPPQPTVGKEMMCPGMMPQMGPGMMPGMMPQMNNVPQAVMVASGNGGVIVLFGDRLLKFDKNLNLVKEVKLQKGKGKKMPGMGPGAMGKMQPPSGQNQPQNNVEQR